MLIGVELFLFLYFFTQVLPKTTYFSLVIIIKNIKIWLDSLLSPAFEDPIISDSH